MWINFNHSFTVIFLDELQKIWYYSYHLTWNLSTHYLYKFECSTALFFMHISQNNVHIRLVGTINWEIFLFIRFICRATNYFWVLLTSQNVIGTFCTAAFNNASLTQSLTDGVTSVHVSKHVCVLRANNFNIIFYNCKLMCVDTGNRIWHLW